MIVIAIYTALVEVNDELRSKEKATLAKIDAALNAEANEPGGAKKPV